MRRLRSILLASVVCAAGVAGVLVSHARPAAAAAGSHGVNTCYGNTCAAPEPTFTVQPQPTISLNP